MPQAVAKPDPDHPITVEPTPGRVVVRAGGRIIADTTRALTLREADHPPVQYLPPDAVAPGVLHPTPTSTTCAYKGQASYYALVTDDGEVPDAVWSYKTPKPIAAAIAGYVAFYPQHVDLTVEPAPEQTTQPEPAA